MKEVAKENLLQIKELLGNLAQENYTPASTILSGASIGQHVRHVLEFYLLLVSGSFTGLISYDKRERDTRLENHPDFARDTIDRLIMGIETLDLKRPVKLEADYTTDGKIQAPIDSSVGRELAYCIEHSIHHQALIKAALLAQGLSNIIDEKFGVAYSTLRFRKGPCAQ